MDVPRSKQFDDVYFSKQDGLAESRYVFLGGNDLPDAWNNKEHFTICESGFGTGLNFLAVLKLWLESDAGQRPASLHFISFEKYPLDKELIENALLRWGELKEVLAKLLAVYPVDLSSGIYELSVMDGVRLTLIFGDINNEIPKLTFKHPRENGDLGQVSIDSLFLGNAGKGGINCWFLDGFKPSSNPDMWSDLLFENMARLSNNGASFATFTAAGFVRRGLEAVGFNVRKIRGFGNKREMCVGLYKGDNKCV